MQSSYQKGEAAERELVNMFYDADWGVTRTPGSGGGTERELPDVLAGNGREGIFYAIEAKVREGNYLYLTGVETEALVFFSQNFGATPRVGVRFDREDWSFFHPADLHVTDAGNYRVKREIARKNGITFDEMIGNL